MISKLIKYYSKSPETLFSTDPGPAFVQFLCLKTLNANHSSLKGKYSEVAK